MRQWGNAAVRDEVLGLGSWVLGRMGLGGPGLRSLENWTVLWYKMSELVDNFRHFVPCQIRTAPTVIEFFNCYEEMDFYGPES